MLWKTPLISWRHVRLNHFRKILMIFFSVRYFNVFLNMLPFLFNYSSLNSIINSVWNNFVYQSNNGIEIVTMQKSVRYSNLVAILWPLACFFIPIPRLAIFIYTEYDTRRLPLNLEFPYDWTESPYYELTLLFQFVTDLIPAFEHGATDIFYLAVTILLSQQFKILGSNLRNCVYRSLIDIGCEKQQVVSFSQLFNSNKK